MRDLKDEHGRAREEFRVRRKGERGGGETKSVVGFSRASRVPFPFVRTLVQSVIDASERGKHKRESCATCE